MFLVSHVLLVLRPSSTKHFVWLLLIDNIFIYICIYSDSNASCVSPLIVAPWSWKLLPSPRINLEAGQQGGRTMATHGISWGQTLSNLVIAWLMVSISVYDDPQLSINFPSIFHQFSICSVRLKMLKPRTICPSGCHLKPLPSGSGWQDPLSQLRGNIAWRWALLWMAMGATWHWPYSVRHGLTLVDIGRVCFPGCKVLSSHSHLNNFLI